MTEKDDFIKSQEDAKLNMWKRYHINSLIKGSFFHKKVENDKPDDYENDEGSNKSEEEELQKDSTKSKNLPSNKKSSNNFNFEDDARSIGHLTPGILSDVKRLPSGILLNSVQEIAINFLTNLLKNLNTLEKQAKSFHRTLQIYDHHIKVEKEMKDAIQMYMQLKDADEKTKMFEKIRLKAEEDSKKMVKSVKKSFKIVKDDLVWPIIRNFLIKKGKYYTKKSSVKVAKTSAISVNNPKSNKETEDNKKTSNMCLKDDSNVVYKTEEEIYSLFETHNSTVPSSVSKLK